MNEDDKNLSWSRRLSAVPRNSVIHTLRNQTVDQHSFHVAQIAMWLLPKHVRGCELAFASEVVRHALNHDLPEAVIGDIPGPAKTKGLVDVQPNIDGSYELDGQVVLLVKCADHLEHLVYTSEEQALGNSTLGRIHESNLRGLGHVYKRTHWMQGSFIDARDMLSKIWECTRPDVHPLEEYSE